MSTSRYAAPHPVWNWRETPAQIDWSDLNKSKKLSTSSSAKVAAAAQAGVNKGTIHGLSKKSDAALARQRYSPAIEGREAGQQSADKRAALRRGTL